MQTSQSTSHQTNQFKKQTLGNQTILIPTAVPYGCLVKKLAQRIFFGVSLHKQKPECLAQKQQQSNVALKSSDVDRCGKKTCWGHNKDID